MALQFQSNKNQELWTHSSQTSNGLTLLTSINAGSCACFSILTIIQSTNKEQFHLPTALITLSLRMNSSILLCFYSLPKMRALTALSLCMKIYAFVVKIEARKFNFLHRRFPLFFPHTQVNLFSKINNESAELQPKWLFSISLMTLT